MNQITNHILMVRPVAFRKIEQTAINNFFQEDLDLKDAEINSNAQQEFDGVVNLLRGAGVHVVVVQPEENLDSPDSIFPNNWVTFHHNGDVTLFPMFAENRRRERQSAIFQLLRNEGFTIRNIIDITEAEKTNRFLEGTESMILDHVNRKAYCALSPRADQSLLHQFCAQYGYTPISFIANQTVGGKRLPIYHTNVMMCLGETFAVICLSAIDNAQERENVIHHLHSDNKEVIEISDAQMHHFAGNMLQVLGSNEKRYLVMSRAALESLHQEQISALEQSSEILSTPLDIIETCGGGSARCMMAEVFLPVK